MVFLMPDSDLAPTDDYKDLLDSIRELIDEYTRSLPDDEPERAE